MSLTFLFSQKRILQDTFVAGKRWKKETNGKEKASLCQCLAVLVRFRPNSNRHRIVWLYIKQTEQKSRVQVSRCEDVNVWFIGLSRKWIA